MSEEFGFPDLPATDKKIVIPAKKVCDVPLSNMRRKLCNIATNATEAELEAHGVYDDENLDQYGYFEDFYKLWSNHKIEELRSRIKELEAELLRMWNRWPIVSDYNWSADFPLAAALVKKKEEE